MFDLGGALAELAERLDGTLAAVVIEASGLEVETWGEADFEAVAAEWAELWKGAGSADALLGSGRMGSFQIAASGGNWVAVPLGADYLLAVLTDPEVPAGKARFYSAEWAARHREDFS